LKWNYHQTRTCFSNIADISKEQSGDKSNENNEIDPCSNLPKK